MATLADIQVAADTVTSNVTALATVVEEQAIPLLNQLAAGQQVDPAAAQAIVDELTRVSQAATTTASDLSAAIAADTPPTP